MKSKLTMNWIESFIWETCEKGLRRPGCLPYAAGLCQWEEPDFMLMQRAQSWTVVDWFMILTCLFVLRGGCYSPSNWFFVFVYYFGVFRWFYNVASWPHILCVLFGLFQHLLQSTVLNLTYLSWRVCSYYKARHYWQCVIVQSIWWTVQATVAQRSWGKGLLPSPEVSQRPPLPECGSGDRWPNWCWKGWAWEP